MGPAYAPAVRGLGIAVATALLLALACRCAAAQPSAGSGCMPELVRLSPCMDYLSGNATTPDGPSCCSALSAMLASSPGCLCMVVGGTAASLGVAVDGARAAQLPRACKVQAPPASQCNAVGAPTSSPGDPAAAPPSDANATPAGTGSKATPASTLPYSGGSTGAGRPGTIFVFAGAALAFLNRF